jgi:hypothetical protein
MYGADRELQSDKGETAAGMAKAQNQGGLLQCWMMNKVGQLEREGLDVSGSILGGRFVFDSGKLR